MIHCTRVDGFVVLELAKKAVFIFEHARIPQLNCLVHGRGAQGVGITRAPLHMRHFAAMQPQVPQLQKRQNFASPNKHSSFKTDLASSVNQVR